jgi:hypothetical protein
MWRSLWWFVFPLIGIAACGACPDPGRRSAHEPRYLPTTVPTGRSITISPGKAKLGNWLWRRPGTPHIDACCAGFPNALLGRDARSARQLSHQDHKHGRRLPDRRVRTERGSIRWR